MRWRFTVIDRIFLYLKGEIRTHIGEEGTYPGAEVQSLGQVCRRCPARMRAMRLKGGEGGGANQVAETWRVKKISSDMRLIQASQLIVA
jgi:hypothetical protein